MVFRPEVFERNNQIKFQNNHSVKFLECNGKGFLFKSILVCSDPQSQYTKIGLDIELKTL